FESWLAATREDVRQCQLKVWRKLVGLLANEPERALPYARCIVEEDPLGESGWATLIALLGAAGRTEEAEAQRAVAVRTLESAGIPVPASLLRTAKAAPPPFPPPPRPVEGRPVIRQRVEFCTAPDGTGLAYSCFGSGPPPGKSAIRLNTPQPDRARSNLHHRIEDQALQPLLTLAYYTRIAP